MSFDSDNSKARVLNLWWPVAFAYMVPVFSVLIASNSAVWYGEGSVGKLGGLTIFILILMGFGGALVGLFHGNSKQRFVGGLAVSLYILLVLAQAL